MDEQPVVFDETFDDGTNIRRRDIMPVGLKMYVWVGMVLGVLFFMFPAISLLAYETVEGSQLEYKLAVMLGFAILGIVLFVMTFLLWNEVKWAIRFNWVVMALFFVIGIKMFTISFSGLLLAPYWIWLYRIQKKWEQ